LQLIATNGSPNITWPRAWYPGVKPAWKHKFGRVPMLLQHWNAPITTCCGRQIYASSYRYYTKGPLVAFELRRLTEAARLPSELLEALQTNRAILDQPSPPNRMAISLDEWGFGPPWSVTRFGAAHALYAVNALTMLVHHARSLGIASANYFQPVNEGVVSVGPHNTSLTSIGEAVALLARHQGQRLLPLPTSQQASEHHMPPGVRVRQLPASSTSDADATDLSVLASVDDDAHKLLITAINGNAAVAARLRVALAAQPAQRGGWSATVLRGMGFTAQLGHRYGGAGWFEPERAHAVAEGRRRYATVVVPPYSMVQLARALD